MSKAFARLGVVLLGLAACTRQEAAMEPPSSDVPASIELRDASGRVVANATVSESGGIRIRVDSAGLAPGSYGVHVHAIGRCDPPAFESAGPHWNPTSRQHGTLNPLGPHLGDLPNFSVGTDGSGAVEFSIAAAALRRGDHELIDGDGAALVIHARPDDYRTDPSGNSGARIACGVIAGPR